MTNTARMPVADAEGWPLSMFPALPQEGAPARDLPPVAALEEECRRHHWKLFLAKTAALELANQLHHFQWSAPSDDAPDQICLTCGAAREDGHTESAVGAAFDAFRRAWSADDLAPPAGAPAFHFAMREAALADAYCDLSKLLAAFRRDGAGSLDQIEAAADQLLCALTMPLARAEDIDPGALAAWSAAAVACLKGLAAEFEPAPPGQGRIIPETQVALARELVERWEHPELYGAAPVAAVKAVGDG